MTDEELTKRATYITRTSLISFTRAFLDLKALTRRGADLDQAEILVRSGHSGMMIDYIDNNYPERTPS